ncbi:head-tail adaptor protein [Citrobacter freundii]|uniref:phage head completion protein n=1 Tax=Citrobacter freundii TaxID=546 RepID=UPI003A97CAB6
MSLKPEEMTCRLSIGYMQSGRGPLGEHLPEQLIETGKAWAKRELVSGRKVRTLDQQQVVETCLFTTHPNLKIDIDWKITTSDRVYTVRNVERLADRIIITGEADARHDRAGIKGST